MFNKHVYEVRRNRLRHQVGSGLILIPGNGESSMNYKANLYPFRQDSNFLYFSGIDLPNLALTMDTETNDDILYGNDVEIEDIIWTGPLPSLASLAQKAGIKTQRPLAKLEEAVQQALQKGRKVHFLPPYRGERSLWIESLLGIRAAAANRFASVDLILAVADMRSVKAIEEILEIESALQVTASMYAEASRIARPGVRENEVAGKMEGTALEAGRRLAFPPLVTVRGETMHNAPTENRLKKGDLLLLDTGAESARHYASDITRTLPVGGRFSTKQKEIYETVLQMQLWAIDNIKPGVPYRTIHLGTAKILVENLKSIGLMKGNPSDAVAAGAHALFFMHGLGHMLGLDVHDMEDLGEQHVGYDSKTERSKQFGLAYLRLARQLEPGFVITVEPGCYFNPSLTAQWKKEKKLAQFINYPRLESYKGFGGIRIEDNILVTSRGSRVLGSPIPKGLKEIQI